MWRRRRLLLLMLMLMLMLQGLGQLMPVKAAVAALPMVIISGASSGLGRQAAIDLAAEKRFHLVLGCRNETSALETVDLIRRAHGSSSVEFLELDLADFSSVERFAREGIKDRPVHAIVHNAGVLLQGSCQRKTKDGLEETVQVNHLSPFLLTQRLLPNLRAAREGLQVRSRVVVVSSGAHRYAKPLALADLGAPANFSGWAAYANSKLCNVLFVRELDRRFGGDCGVLALAVRPGTVDTGIARHAFGLRVVFAVFRPLLTSLEDGAEVLVQAVLDPARRPGAYYDKLHERLPAAAARDDQAARALWEWSEATIASRLSL